VDVLAERQILVRYYSWFFTMLYQKSTLIIQLF